MKAAAADKKFEFRPQHSTGLETALLYKTAGPGAPVSQTKGDMTKAQPAPVNVSMETLLKEAPVGARVAWTNAALIAARSESPWINENTIKVQEAGKGKPALFAAFGAEAGTARRFTADEMATLMATKAGKNPADKDFAQYVKNNIFVSEIEQYKLK